MIDEFQYLSSHVYRREDLSGKPVEGMPGSFHEVSESKIAPMLVTGSYVGWMIDIMGKYLEAGGSLTLIFLHILPSRKGCRLFTNMQKCTANRLQMKRPFKSTPSAWPTPSSSPASSRATAPAGI
jgi:hypothetical protein